jgi:hypothetical protein
MMAPLFKKVTCGTGLFLLAACTTEPFVEDWQRERITAIPNGEIEVSICFDLSEHSRDQVYSVAREECSARITEVQNLVQFEDAQLVRYQTQAEGARFSGPVDRKNRIQAMINNLQLVYVENDKWECPVMIPNRITFECRYDSSATDSSKRQNVEAPKLPDPELPPQLPEDLKP